MLLTAFCQSITPSLQHSTTLSPHCFGQQRLALERAQFLLLAQQMEALGLAGFWLIDALDQAGQLVISELIPQARGDICQLHAWIVDRPLVGHGFGD